MRYTLVKSTNKTVGSAGKYVARVIHDNTMDVDTFADRISYACSLSKPDVVAALEAFSEQINKSLHNGDKVRLPGLGTFKLEIDCKPVADVADFSPAKNIKRYQVHFLPEKRKCRNAWYEDVELTRVK